MREYLNWASAPALANCGNRKLPKVVRYTSQSPGAGRHWRVVVSRFLIALSCCALVTACSRGAAEFQLYVKAFDEQYDHGQRILDSLARAERIVVKRNLGESARTFTPDKARYYLDNVDPPITASMRASVKSLKDYNLALAALANGEAAEALTNRLSSLTANLAGAISSAAVAMNSPIPVPGLQTFIRESQGHLSAAFPIIQQIAVWASREAFRRELVRTYPAMRGLVQELRKGTPQFFLVLYQSRTSKEQDRPSAEAMSAIEKDREAMAGWVLLLDQTLAAMDAAVEAALSDSPSGDLAALAELSIELKVLAEKVKANRLK